MTDWQSRFSLAGRTALVTGASRGIGFEIARLFAEAGADVAGVARSAADLAPLRGAVEGSGRRFAAVAADLSDPAGPAAAARAAEDALGRIDILVNSAGIALVAPALDLDAQAWDRTMALNLRAPFLLSQAVAPGMIAAGGGKIVMISSQTGVVAMKDHAAYAASKGGLNALTKSLCAEWAGHNIQVNAICPTVVMTPMGRAVWSDPARADPLLAATPLGRFGEPVEVADAALYLASSASGLVNGATLMLDGGFTSV
ncbi:SDR family NAD(P)-dependent oxidoreductase [Jannaschia rubra]|uniref:2-dehydro-3-deoxy-D-gluconate 5-dehydrogenase n=1 Tax=Jannaschia rubra TaxID=282197 RepID=A0A0M6XUB1_9RHOB|nr:glucose 1-dehydrogenase [Jannaschia rubra]CTQ34729.1 2-dehydro-3-deoxy-D-gluconate 5-dehydrogenase [Jannaschia rubra]SFG69277.1 NAD(P)-dependent dehydrogenase, short-chain alcohol dehydrogenase family [Jannaschia rubra]